MAVFDAEGVRIAYDDVGSGPPIVLVHGFASSRKRNWKEVGWYDALIGAGRRVIAFDCRGHGESDKPHDVAAYDAAVMAGDVVHLMNHVGIARADLMGYSMGGRIAGAVLVRHPQRVTCAVLGGVGREGLIGERPNAEAIAKAFEAHDPKTITSQSGRAFRQFAEQGRNDLHALAACMRGLRQAATAEHLQALTIPLLLVVGDRDDLVGDPRALAELLPSADLVVIPGRDHLSTVGDRRYKEAVLEFLARHSPLKP